MAKRKDLRAIKEIQFLRAASVAVEKALRYDVDRNYTIDEIADMGMIRKRYIRQACIEHPKVKAVRRSKSITAFQWDGPQPYYTAYNRGPDPQRMLKGRKK